MSRVTELLARFQAGEIDAAAGLAAIEQAEDLPRFAPQTTEPPEIGRRRRRSSTVPRSGAPQKRLVPLAAIRTDGETQARVRVDPDVVLEYVAGYSGGGDGFMPPVVLFFDSERYWLADGFHRVEAAQRAGRSDIEALVHRGTVRDAMLWAAGANATHGLRRSAADKRKAVLLLLRDPEWTTWSNREIAAHAQVSHTFVNRLRAEVEGPPGGNVSTATRDDLDPGSDVDQVEEPLWDVVSCRVCGCTDEDCSGCIERTGQPCSWVHDPTGQGDLCSACLDLAGEDPPAAPRRPTWDDVDPGPGVDLEAELEAEAEARAWAREPTEEAPLEEEGDPCAGLPISPPEEGEDGSLRSWWLAGPRAHHRGQRLGVAWEVTPAPEGSPAYQAGARWITNSQTRTITATGSSASGGPWNGDRDSAVRHAKVRLRDLDHDARRYRLSQPEDLAPREGGTDAGAPPAPPARADEAAAVRPAGPAVAPGAVGPAPEQGQPLPAPDPAPADRPRAHPPEGGGEAAGGAGGGPGGSEAAARAEGGSDGGAGGRVAALREALADLDGDELREVLGGVRARDVRAAVRTPRRMHDAYYTPPEVAEACLERLGIWSLDLQVLEPSVGGGAWARLLLDRQVTPDWKSTATRKRLTVVDIDREAAGLQVEGVEQSIVADFLDHDFGDQRWDIIVGNPPFDQAEAHVRRALNLLAPGGRLGFLLRRNFCGPARFELLDGLAPMQEWVLGPRVSFDGEGTDSQEYSFFVWQQGRELREWTTRTLRWR